MKNRKCGAADFVIGAVIGRMILAVVIPFVNTTAISFASQREYLDTPLLLFPKEPTLNNYKNLLGDERIRIGYLTSLKILLLGLPLNLFLTTSLAYGTSRKAYPGKKLILYAVLFTMLFNGCIFRCASCALQILCGRLCLQAASMYSILSLRGIISARSQRR